MIGYILITVLMIVFAVFAYICDKHAWYGNAWEVLEMLSIAVCIISFAFAFFSGVYMLTKNGDGEKFSEKRDYYQELVYHLSDGMSFSTVERTVNEAKNINARIDDNKKHADSKMWGFLYNKRIAEVEPIDIPVIEYKVFKFKEEDK